MSDITKIKWLIAFSLFFLVLLGSQASAMELSDCSKCHDFRQKPDSDVTKFQLPSIPDGSATGSMVDKRTCISCHSYLIYPNHQKIQTQLAVVNSIVYGAFQNINSLYTSSDQIHYYHSGIGVSKATGMTCLKCHAAASCYSCHNNVPHKDHYSASAINPKTDAPIITPTLTVATGSIYNENGTIYPTWKVSTSCAASECHKQLPGVLTKTGDGNDLCLNCHNTGTQGHTDVSAQHVSGYVDNVQLSCSNCHNSSLDVEHGLRNGSDGKPLDCYTCHLSSDANVKAAISNKDTHCSACHSDYNHLELHTDSLDENCRTCHKSDLVTEHLYNSATQKAQLGCESCHNNASPDIQRAIAANDKECSACHNQFHSLNLAQGIPADIPLYSGFIWSVPQPADIWKSEPWMPSGYEGGKMIVSNRRNDVTGQQVWAFYKQAMADGGWTAPVNEPAVGENIFSAEFAKGTRKATVFFYGGENHTTAPLVPSGYRIEILYY